MEEESIESLAHPQYSPEERLLFCRAVANMIGTDRQVTEDEWVNLVGLAHEAGLALVDTAVRETLEKELRHPGPLEPIVGSLANPKLKRMLYRTLVEIAFADGHLHKDEEAKLVDAARIFGLNADAAKELIRWTQQSIALEQQEQAILEKL